MAKLQRRPKFKSALIETAIDVVSMRWFLPARLKHKKTAVKLIELTGQILPEAMPKRYGEYEPFKNKPDGGNYSSFYSLWHEQTQNDFAMFFFKSTAPCFGGTVVFSHPNSANKYPGNTAEHVDIEFQFDARAFDDPFWCEAISNWFFEMSHKLGAFYAVAYLESGYTTRLNNLSISAGNFTNGEEGALYPFPNSDRWLGLPPIPTWLSWYGGPYSDIVRPFVENPSIEHRTGFGCRIGPKPMGLADLQGCFPSIPEKYLMKLPGTAAVDIPDPL